MSDILLTEQTSASATPAAGRVVIYPKNDGYLYFKNDTGIETRVNPQTVATAAEWTAANTVLAAGVFGVASDTGNFKIGDGATAWNSLAYWRYTAEHITIATTGGNTVLTIPQSRASSMAVTGALTSNVTITTPDVMALFVAENLTTGAFTVTFKTAAGSGVEVVQGTHATLYADGVSIENPTTGGVGSGDVVGPTSSTNNRIATFNGTTGKIIKDSGMLLSDLATSAQGALADSALQAAAIGTTVQAYDADLTTWAGVTPGTGVATFLAIPSLANFNAALSDADIATGGGTATGTNTGDQTATTVANTPAGSIAATTVQAAINELDTEKAALAGSATQAFAMVTAAANTNTTQGASTAYADRLTAGTLPGAFTTLSANSVTTGGADNTGFAMRVYTGGSFAAIYNRSVTPGLINYALVTNGAQTTINGSTTSGLEVAGNTIAVASSTGLAVTGTIKTSGYTVGTLPAGTTGDRAYVTDAIAPTYLGALTGGGAVVCPVFKNATAWVSA